MKVGNVVGLVGWRGMVGSVLIDRMIAEGDFDLIEPIFFSTSNAGGRAPLQAKTSSSCKMVLTLSRSKSATSSLPRKAATIRPRFILSCAPQVGQVIGLTRLKRCA